MTSKREARAAAVVALLAATAAPAGSPGAAQAEPGASAPEPVNAIWLKYEFSFTYFGRGTYYSCDGLRNKIEHVLEAVGGRNPRVTASCLDGYAVQQLTAARIRVELPTEVTPQLLARLAADQSKRELLARVTGKGDQVDAATAQFPAQRHLVAFESRRGDHIQDGDCELLEQLLPRVLEPMGVRETAASRLDCTPGLSQSGAVDLQLESLRPLPPPAHLP